MHRSDTPEMMRSGALARLCAALTALSLALEACGGSDDGFDDLVSQPPPAASGDADASTPRKIARPRVGSHTDEGRSSDAGDER